MTAVRLMPGSDRSRLPFKPYVYRGTGKDTLTAFMDERKPPVPRKPRTLKPCGTVAAYRRHTRHGEEPCDACKAAKSRYEKRNLVSPQVRREAA